MEERHQDPIQVILLEVMVVAVVVENTLETEVTLELISLDQVVEVETKVDSGGNGIVIVRKST